MKIEHRLLHSAMGEKQNTPPACLAGIVYKEMGDSYSGLARRMAWNRHNASSGFILPASTMVRALPLSIIFNLSVFSAAGTRTPAPKLRQQCHTAPTQ
jgi:hypothetical protein